MVFFISQVLRALIFLGAFLWIVALGVSVVLQKHKPFLLWTGKKLERILPFLLGFLLGIIVCLR